MDLHLPTTTVNGEPIDDLVLAVPPLLGALSSRIESALRDEPLDRLVLVPCVQRALVPIWIGLREADELHPAPLEPVQALVLLGTAIFDLFELVDDALRYNAVCAASWGATRPGSGPDDGRSLGQTSRSTPERQGASSPTVIASRCRPAQQVTSPTSRPKYPADQ